MFRACTVALALLVIAGVGPTAARPRDEVLSGAFRCGEIGDSRTWLDCYYGAAEPMRAALGLASVRPSQAELVRIPPSGGAPRDPALRDSIMGEASRCYTSGDDRTWLNCYYAAVQPMRALLGLPPAPQAAAKAATGIATTKPPHGSWLTGGRRGEVAHMTAYTFNGQGQFTVTLDNGQVWRQMPGDVQKARWMRPPGRYAVTITPGALGSTNFAVNGTAVLFKVELVR